MKNIRQRKNPGYPIGDSPVSGSSDTVLPLTIHNNGTTVRNDYSAARRKRSKPTRWNTFVRRIACCCSLTITSTPIILIFNRSQSENYTVPNSENVIDNSAVQLSDTIDRLLNNNSTVSQNIKSIVWNTKNKIATVRHKIISYGMNKQNPSVALKDRNKYETITCKDGTIGYVNDNYCDCTEEGEDETLTSACSNVRIQRTAITCQSATDTNGQDTSIIVIYPSRINDGIRDCLDGSDEN